MKNAYTAHENQHQHLILLNGAQVLYRDVLKVHTNCLLFISFNSVLIRKADQNVIRASLDPETLV